MSRTTRIKIGAMAALWAIIAVAAVAGWMIGHGNAALQISELKQRLAVSGTPRQTCGLEIELIEARAAEEPRGTNLFRLTLDGILPGAPRHLHLREMLTAR